MGISPWRCWDVGYKMPASSCSRPPCLGLPSAHGKALHAGGVSYFKSGKLLPLSPSPHHVGLLVAFPPTINLQANRQLGGGCIFRTEAKSSKL